MEFLSGLNGQSTEWMNPIFGSMQLKGTLDMSGNDLENVGSINGTPVFQSNIGELAFKAADPISSATFFRVDIGAQTSTSLCV